VQVCFTVQYDKEYLLETARRSSAKTAIVRGTATAVILGEQRDDWQFSFLGLDSQHVMAVALGPLEDAIDSYKEDAWISQGLSVSPAAMNSARLGNLTAEKEDKTDCVLFSTPPQKLLVKDLCTEEVRLLLDQVPPEKDDITGDSEKDSSQRRESQQAVRSENKEYSEEETLLESIVDGCEAAELLACPSGTQSERTRFELQSRLTCDRRCLPCERDRDGHIVNPILSAMHGSAEDGSGSSSSDDQTDCSRVCAICRRCNLCSCSCFCSIA
jgi:hypothetical protein